MKLHSEYHPDVLKLLAFVENWPIGHTTKHPKRDTLLAEKFGDALAVCLGDTPPLLRVYAVGVLGTPDRVALTTAGKAVLARSRMGGADGGKHPKKKTGRPRKSESSSVVKIVSALCEHHHYAKGGSVLNLDPISTENLAELAGVSIATVSRFMKSKFPKTGYAGYAADCVRDKIGLALGKWQGDLSDAHFEAAVDEGIRRRAAEE